VGREVREGQGMFGDVCAHQFPSWEKASAEAGAFEFGENVCRKGNSFVLLGKIFVNDTRLRKPFMGCAAGAGWFCCFMACRRTP